MYQLKDIWGNTRITYADDNGNGSVNSSEIRREQNYYPFGLEHKGYNGNLSGVENNYKTYQGQEFTKDLDLNTHEWKYRMSDPSIGRFWQIDPLAEDYVYNSTYAFQENKMGMGVELEGLELMDTNGKLLYDPKTDSFTDNATPKMRKIINRMRSTETGEQQFQKTFDTPIKVDFFAVNDGQAPESAAGKTINTGNPVSEYDSKTKENSVVGFEVSSSTIDIFATKGREVYKDAKSGKGSSLNGKSIPKNFSIEDVMAVILGHEIEHTTNENATLRAQGKSEDKIEEKPTEVSNKIVDELSEKKKN